MTMTTHPTHAGLLAAVLERPEDDDVRLILADWLQEHGQPARAEFIRDQVWNAPGSLDLDLLDVHLEEWCPWFERHDELGFSRDHARNTNGLKVVHLGGETTFWRRGFLDSVYLKAADWLAHADALTAAQPVREVRLMTWPTIAASPGRYWYGLPGRENRVAINEVGSIPGRNLTWTQVAAEKLLAREWPRITFTLPDA